MPLETITDRAFHGTARNAKRLCGNANTAPVQGFHGDLKSLSNGTDDPFGPDTYIGKAQRAGIAGTNSKLIFLLTDFKSRHSFIDKKTGNAMMLFRSVGLREDNIVIGRRAIGDPVLCTV